MAKKNNQKTVRICWIAKTTNQSYTPDNGEPKWVIVGHMFGTRLEANQYLAKHYPNRPSRVVGGRLPATVVSFPEKTKA